MSHGPILLHVSPGSLVRLTFWSFIVGVVAGAVATVMASR